MPDDAKTVHLKEVWADGYNTGVAAAWKLCRERLVVVLLLGVCFGVGVLALVLLLIKAWSR